MAEEINAENFPSYTTVHGLKFTVRGNHPVRRVIWTLTILLTLAALFRQFFVSIEKVSKKDTMIITTVRQNDLIKFPAVSICNMNMMKKSKINGTDSQVFLDKLDRFRRQDLNQRFSSSFFDIQEASRQNGHKLKDMIVRCLWRSEICTEKNFTMFYSFHRGLCYTFNSGKQGHPLQYAQGPGIENGLILTLNAEVDEYYGMFSYEGAGFKVLVHDQDDYPDMEIDGFGMSAGFKLSYSMKKEKYLGLSLPTCHETSQSSDVYSQSACITKCKMAKLMKACECRIFVAPETGEFEGLPLCNFVKKQVQECVLEFLSTNSECECPLPCTRERYRGNSMVSKYPSPHFWTTYEENKNKSQLLNSIVSNYDGLKKDSLSFLQIFYSTSEERIMKEILVYNFNDLIADFGGFLGLFLGCSCLTLCEFIDLLITWCRRRLHKDQVTVIG